MLHLAGRLELPAQNQPRPLQQMAGHLDVADVRRVVLGVDVVVLQDAVRVEVVHEGPAQVLEVLVHPDNLVLVLDRRLVLRADFLEGAPLRLADR